MKKLLAVVFACGAITAQADNFRCGRWVANSDLSVTELVAKCGEPDSREKRTEDVYARNAAGGTYKTGAVSITEIWVYKRTNAAAMVVTIVDGKIESIRRQE